MGISLSDFNPFRAAKKVTKAVAKPFRKASKFLPRELRWAAPYLAAVAPYSSFMMPGTGIMSSGLGRSALAGLYNVAGQAIADPEGEDINLLSTLMAGGTGALGAEGMGTKLRSGIERGVTGVDQFGDIPVSYTESPGFWQGAENIGREGLATASDFITGAGEGLASLGKNPASLFTKEGAKAAAMDIAPIAISGTGDLSKAMGDKAMRDWEAAAAAEQAEIEATTTANEQEQADLTMKYYRQAGHDEATIQEALEINGLGDYYVPPVTAANGGIIGLKHGGMLNFGGREMDLRGG